MNFYLFFLLILLVSHDLFAHSSLATRKLQDMETKTKKLRGASNNFRDKLYYSSSVEGNHHVKRKALHEVHSGANPISNSINS
ncbi:hypothetical protein D8674_005153 [Pyrus ussuriensis x Pyrus communis]|uniref:Uncharacterized protein n=1 Tax=Pyrus ussuriensis x Pyrus communis TaxID=2448454 RepID=A0A5N5FQN3_9ROSA|nr:hypothetical protein D8674_005153 [Pyrus ussuriensis x Pyrus communis]